MTLGLRMSAMQRQTVEELEELGRALFHYFVTFLSPYMSNKFDHQVHIQIASFARGKTNTTCN